MSKRKGKVIVRRDGWMDRGALDRVDWGSDGFLVIDPISEKCVVPGDIRVVVTIAVVKG